MKKTAFARKLREPKYGAAADKVPADQLRKGDIVLVEAGDIIPCDGEVIEGAHRSMKAPSPGNRHR